MGKRRFLGWLSALVLLVSACGGSSSDGLSVTPPTLPPPSAAPDISLTEVFTQISLSQPLVMRQAPGDPTRWFVAERAGVIRVFDNDSAVNATEVFLDIRAQVSTLGEGGLLGMAFHPAFPATPEVFVSYTTAPDGQLLSVISRFRSENGGATLNPATEEPLMLVPQPQSNHNGGNIVFGPDGYLYIGFGDGGGGGDPGENAQNLSNVLGAMLRIDIDGLAPYEVPIDNPFVTPDLCAQGFGGTEPCPEIFAYGLRNPWRFSFDSATGELWLGDVGQNAWEEVDVITSGGDYGWDDREGAHCFEPSTGCITDSIDPVTEYGRALGTSITGGHVYRGAAITGLEGWYVFGDFGSGRVFGIPADSSSFVEPEVLMDTDLSIVTFAEDLDGELYVLDIATGRIFRITAAP